MQETGGLTGVIRLNALMIFGLELSEESDG